MWTQWLERVLNAHDAASYTVRRHAPDAPRTEDEIAAGSRELDPGELVLVVEEMQEP